MTLPLNKIKESSGIKLNNPRICSCGKVWKSIPESLVLRTATGQLVNSGLLWWNCTCRSTLTCEEGELRGSTLTVIEEEVLR